MSSVLKQTVTLFSWLTLIGCSHPPDSDTLAVDPSVTTCTPLKALQLPQGLTLLPADQRYQIPEKPLSNGIAPLVDTRPPIQPLALLPGSEAYYQENRALLQLEQTTNIQALWQELKQCLAQLGVVTASLDKRQRTLITGWVNKTDTYRARYQISLSQKAGSPTLVVQGVELQKKVKQTLQPSAIEPPQQTGQTHEFQTVTPWPNQQRDYEILMLNRITTILEKQRTTLEKTTQVTPSPAGLDKQR